MGNLRRFLVNLPPARGGSEAMSARCVFWTGWKRVEGQTLPTRSSSTMPGVKEVAVEEGRGSSDGVGRNRSFVQAARGLSEGEKDVGGEPDNRKLEITIRVEKGMMNWSQIYHKFELASSWLGVCRFIKGKCSLS